MLETSARLLRLLSLLQARRFWRGADLAERLEITERTLRRDVDRLRTLGYPVQSTAGVAGGYQLGQGASLPPLSLDDDEALATTIALRTVASGSVARVEDAALRALVKLEQVLPKRVQRRVEAWSHVVALGASPHAVDMSLLSEIANACRDHRELRFSYSDRARVEQERRVEPSGLVHAGPRWYLVGWDTARRDWRTFRVDRIAPPVHVEGAFLPRPPPDGDLATYVSRSVSTAAYKVQASIVLHAPIETLRERISPSTGMLEPIDAQHCRLRVGASSLEGLTMWLGTLGHDFRIEAPPSLEARMREIGERLLRSCPATD